MNIKNIIATESYGDRLEEAVNRDSVKELYKDIDPNDSAKTDEIKGNIIEGDSTAINYFADLMLGKKVAGVKAPKIGEVFHDFLSSRDFPFIIPPAIEVVMKQYILPQTFVHNQIFQTIPFNGIKIQQINFTSLGPIGIEEVGRGEPYPEVGSSIMDKAFRMALDIKKYGVKLGIENELLESDNWGVLGFLVSQIMDGFAIKKEWEAMKLLTKMGHTVFDNANPANGSELRITSGRAIDGSLNGTITLQDLMAIWSYGNLRGFNYDTLLIHPFAWQMFATDPDMKELLLEGAKAAYTPSGKPGPGFEGPFGAQWGYPNSRYGGSNQTSQYYTANSQAVDPVFAKQGFSPFSNTLTSWGASFNIAPSGMWPSGLRVIVTPYIPWYQDNTSKKYVTNLYFVDSQKTGVILQGEGPLMEEWSDVEKEVKYMKFKEKYGMAVVYQGRGVAVARNIVIDRNYIFQNNNNVTLSPITHTSGVNYGAANLFPITPALP